MRKKAVLVVLMVALLICLLGCTNEAGSSKKKNSSYESVNPEGPVSFVPGIFADTSQVTEGPATVLSCRYWPGELTLDDGTVVESADKFYVRKVGTDSYSYYYLYYPATIYDIYEENGGGFSGFRTLTDTAFIWYLNTYYPEINLDAYPFNITNAKAFCDSIMSKDYIEPLAKDVKYDRSRTTVFSDPKKLGSDLSGFECSCINYNMNDLQDEKGTPYYGNEFYCDTSWSFVLIYYPRIICDIYELVTKGGNSGSDFWTYLDIYFPNLDTQNPKEYVETLVGHFIEPRIEDYQEYLKTHSYLLNQ